MQFVGAGYRKSSAPDWSAMHEIRAVVGLSHHKHVDQQQIEDE
jgi:hypothetical protein